MAPGEAPQRIDGQWIVRFEKSASKKQFRSARDGAKGRGAKMRYEYSKVFQGFAAKMSDSEVSKLRKNKHVLSVEPDYEIRATGTQSPTPSWGLDRIDQSGLPLNSSYTYSSTGAGVTAYVIDTGIRASHTEFGGRVATGWSAINDGRGTDDCAGHGTHVAGTIGGATYGVAKAVTLVPVRVLDCNGSGSTSGVIAGVDWVTNRVKSIGGLAVANMSLGGSASSSLDNAVTNAVNAGVSFAVAAANDNTDACNQSPARAPAAVTVGASTKTDARASFSNYGTCLDIFAPGENIVSSVNSSDTATATYSGTSMASPHVADVMAAYLQANPTASPATVRNALVAAAGDALGSNIGSGSPDKLLYNVFEVSTPPTTPPASNAAPVASAPTAVVLAAGNRIGTSSVPMTIRWSAIDADSDAITGYALQHSSNGGSSWSAVSLPSATATSVTVNVGSTSNLFRVRATDARGAVGAYTNGSPFTLTLAQQTAATLAPSANWATVSNSDSSGGSIKQAKAAGSTATCIFTGTQIAWVATYSPNRGRAEVLLDGVSCGVVDLYNSAVSARRILFNRAVAAGSHTLVIKVLGTRTASSASTYVDVDAFVTVR